MIISDSQPWGIRKGHKSTLMDFLKMMGSVNSSECSQRNKVTELKMPYIPGMSLESCFPRCHLCL